MFRMREGLPALFALIIGAILVIVKVRYEHIPSMIQEDDNLQMENIKKAMEAIINFSNQIAGWAVVAIGGSGALLFSDEYISSKLQVFLSVATLSCLIVSIFFSTVIMDLAVRAAATDTPAAVWGSLNEAMWWQYSLLFSGVILLVANFSTIISGNEQMSIKIVCIYVLSTFLLAGCSSPERGAVVGGVIGAAIDDETCLYRDRLGQLYGASCDGNGRIQGQGVIQASGAWLGESYDYFHSRVEIQTEPIGAEVRLKGNSQKF